MKIKTKFRIISGVVIVSIMAIVAVIVYSSNEIYGSYGCTEELDDLISDIYEQKTIIHDYVLRPTKRAELQFKMKQATLHKLLSGMRYSGALYPAEMRRIAGKNEQIEGLFSKIVEIKGGAGDPMGMQLENHLNRQIMINSQRILTLAMHLHRIQSDAIKRILINATLICLGIVTFSGIVMIIVHSMIAMKTVGMIKELDDRAKLIADGNLDFQTNIRSNDEIGELSTSFDIMAQALKDAIDKLKNWNEKLEIAVEERTLALKEAHENLVRAERHAILGRMSGMVAHELRTPLAAMKSSIYYLRTRMSADAPKREKMEKHLGIIDCEIEASNMVITNILTYGRLGDPAFVKLDINDELRRYSRNQGIPGGIRFVLELGSEPLNIEADSHQIGHVVSNVIRNAVESIDGEGTIEIKATKKDGYAWISVKDDGKGIPKSHLPNIFEPLFTTKNTGMGFGLAICKAVVDLHRGHIDVNSSEGDGTEVVIQLPVRQGG